MSTRLERPLRRALCIALALAGAGVRAQPAPGSVLIVRHAMTEPGVGDPPGFRLDQCTTQRNLSAEGRTQALTFGQRLRARGWMPREIRSSRWCRCLDSAAWIAQGLGGGQQPRPWPALDSFFGTRDAEAAQTALLRERLAASDDAGFELWVTHQVNISALTGRASAMGEGLWLRLARDGSIVTRTVD